MKFWNPSTIGFLATLIAGLATLWATQLSRTKDEEKREQELSFRKELDAKNTVLIEKSDEIARLNRELYKSVTGGEGYAKLLLGLRQNGRAIIELMNDTDYPLFDVAARVFEPFKLSAIDKSNPPDIFALHRRADNSTTVIDLGTVKAHTLVRLYPEYVLPSNVEELNLDITVLARNGSVKHLIRFKKDTANVWHSGFVSLGAKSERLAVEDSSNILPENWKKLPEVKDGSDANQNPLHPK